MKYKPGGFIDRKPLGLGVRKRVVLESSLCSCAHRTATEGELKPRRRMNKTCNLILDFVVLGEVLNNLD